MTAFALPPVQPAVKPASSASSKEAGGANDADGGSFQQVLANQASKAKAEAPADKPVQPTPQKQQAASEKAADTAEPAQAEQKTVSTAAAAVHAAKAHRLNEGRTDDAAADKEGGNAAMDMSQLLGFPVSGLTSGQPNAAEAKPDAKSGAGVKPGLSAVPDKQDTLAQRDGKLEHNPAIAGKKDLAPGEKPSFAASDLAKAKSATVVGDDHGQQPDFAQLLAGKELQASAPAAAPVVQTAAQAIAAVSSNVIEPRLGSQGWDTAVNQKVVWMVGAGEQSATLTLNPPDLGPLQVVIHVHNDQANTTFVSDNPEVRQALQDNIATLRNMMNGSGIQLGDTNISAGNQAQQQFQQASRQGEAHGSANARHVVHSAPVESAAIKGYGTGLVDTFA